MIERQDTFIDRIGRLWPFGGAMIKASPIFIVSAACCGLVALLVLTSGRSKKITDLRQELPPVNFAAQELTFKPTMIFDGRTEDGARVAHNVYKASDCALLYTEVIFFKSRERAMQEVDFVGDKASTIVERSDVTNDEGRDVGDRVVLQFEASGEYKAHAEVVWNKDKDFHSITASSLERVLEFEKALASGSGRISSRIDDVQKVTFSALQTREGRTEEGFDYSEKQFRSSDCETVMVRTEYFPSPLSAQDELEKKLKESTTIIERGRKLDATGQQVGERIVAMFKAEVQSEHIEDTVVLWTDNSELHFIQGPFTHVLEFEKRNLSNPY